eukprot:PhF_6_TR7063/c1_g1_i8/m.10668
MNFLPPNDVHLLQVLQELGDTIPPNIFIDFLQSTVTLSPPGRPTLTELDTKASGPTASDGSWTMHVTRSLVTQGEVAIKVYNVHDRRIPDEVRLHIILKHEHIVPAISYELLRMEGGGFQHRLCLKLTHHSLDKEIPVQDEVSMSEARIRKIIRDVLKGLHHMHSQGYYHNDIKPQNIFLDFEGNAYIGDLGSVTNTTATTRQPVTTLVSSSPALFIPYLSPHYMSPEALWGWTPRAANDFWALGITMLSIWLGQLPFDLTMNIETQVSYANMVSKVPPGVSHEARDFVELLFRADTDPTITIEQLMS